MKTYLQCEHDLGYTDALHLPCGYKGCIGNILEKEENKMHDFNMESINGQILYRLSTRSIKAYYDGEEALVLTEDLFKGEPVYLLTRGIQEFSDENASVGSIFWFHDELGVFDTLEDAIKEFERLTK